jgi:purine catabolism regulator
MLAGAGGTGNGVTWAVSLRPYAPAIPPLKGGEIALAGTEALARHEPPVTLADVVRQLGARGASGLVVRGEVNTQAVEAAEAIDLPLLRLPDDAPLHEIEQAIMRECALFQARREIMAAEEPGAWIERLLAGQTATFVEAQGPARREGYTLSASYAVVLVAPVNSDSDARTKLEKVAAAQIERNRDKEIAIIPYALEDGLVFLVPPGGESVLRAVLHGERLACGLGSERPLLEAALSLEEARLALLSSLKLHNGTLVRHAEMGVERMLLLLYLHHKDELGRFVDETLGPILAHDAKSATPLLPTISSYVGHGGRLRETATDMFVHRNTLAYRLDRAAEILDVDLKDADARLAVEIALRALPLLDGQ